MRSSDDQNILNTSLRGEAVKMDRGTRPGCNDGSNAKRLVLIGLAVTESYR